MDLAEREILGYLSTGLGAAITTYYQGEVILPPKLNLPCLMVFGSNAEISARDTKNDQIVYRMNVRIIVNLENYISTSAPTGNVIQAQKALRDLMEGRNADGTYMSASVLGVLRSNAKLHGTYYYYSGNVRTTYKTVQGKQFPYVVADMVFDATSELIARPA